MVCRLWLEIGYTALPKFLFASGFRNQRNGAESNPFKCICSGAGNHGVFIPGTTKNGFNRLLPHIWRPGRFKAQTLLSQCKSVKVKRLFLYMAEKSNHQWFQFLKTDEINIGTGNRMVTEKGVYISKYLISIPTELAELWLHQPIEHR